MRDWRVTSHAPAIVRIMPKKSGSVMRSPKKSDANKNAVKGWSMSVIDAAVGDAF